MATFAVSGSFTTSFSLSGTVKRRKALGTFGSPISFTFSGSLDLDISYIQFSRAITHSFTGIESSLTLNDDPQYLTIVRSQVWWNKAYTYRRILQVQPNDEGFEVDHPLHIVLAKDTVRQGKVNPDGSDIEVLRLVLDVPETWTVVPKMIEDSDTEFVITWPNQVEIPPNTTVRGTYYVYYGNTTLVGAPTDTPEYIPLEWPVSMSYNSSRITYTRPGEHWVDGIGLEDGAKATLQFYGSNVRLMSDIGPSWGISEIQIDEGDWIQADLFSPTISEYEEVFSTYGLSMGYHTIRIKRSGFKAASATDYNINIKSIDYTRHNGVANIDEEADETLMWGSAIGGVVGK